MLASPTPSLTQQLIPLLLQLLLHDPCEANSNVVAAAAPDSVGVHLYVETALRQVPPQYIDDTHLSTPRSQLGL